jgi:hypothetical protein
MPKAKPKAKSRKLQVRTRKPTARTPSTIINTITKRNTNRPPTLSPYVRCRIDPFSAGGKGGIPDGSNSNFVVVDAMVSDTIACSVAGQSFVIQTIPSMPILAALSSASNNVLTLNGVGVNGPTTGLTPNGNVVTSTWYPMGIPLAYQGGVAVAGTVTPDPYSTIAGRFVAIGYRCVYTGPVNNCSGSILITSNDVAFEETQPPDTAAVPVGNQHAILKPNYVQASSGFYVGPGVNTLNLAVINNVSTAQRNTITLRPEEGFTIIPKHKTMDFKVKDASQLPAAILGNTNLAGNGPLTRYTLFPAGELGTGSRTDGIIFYDNDWQAFQIAFTGLNADASFRFETVVCWEINPSMQSSIQTFAKGQSDNKPSEFQQASKLSEMIPAVRTLSGRP